MGKYGKKNSVDLNPLHYNIAFLGEGGIGKTTLCYQMCENLSEMRDICTLISVRKMERMLLRE